MFYETLLAEQDARIKELEAEVAEMEGTLEVPSILRLMKND